MPLLLGLSLAISGSLWNRFSIEHFPVKPSHSGLDFQRKLWVSQQTASFKGPRPSALCFGEGFLNCELASLLVFPF